MTFANLSLWFSVSSAYFSWTKFSNVCNYSSGKLPLISFSLIKALLFSTFSSVLKLQGLIFPLRVLPTSLAIIISIIILFNITTSNKYQKNIIWSIFCTSAKTSSISEEKFVVHIAQGGTIIDASVLNKNPLGWTFQANRTKITHTALNISIAESLLQMETRLAPQTHLAIRVVKAVGN